MYFKMIICASVTNNSTYFLHFFAIVVYALFTCVCGQQRQIYLGRASRARERQFRQQVGMRRREKCMIPTSCQGPPRGGEEAPPFLKRRGRDENKICCQAEEKGRGGGEDIFCGYPKRAKLHVYCTYNIFGMKMNNLSKAFLFVFSFRKKQFCHS